MKNLFESKTLPEPRVLDRSDHLRQSENHSEISDNQTHYLDLFGIREPPKFI